jgi:phage terminase large subunit-like protein
MVTRGAPSRSLAADAGPALGLAPSFWIFDEFGASPDRRLFDALRTGTGKRVNSVRVIISTQAETDQHPFSQMIDACIAGRAPGTALQLIAAPTDADAFDPETLKAANPAWGEYLNPTNLLNEMEEAKRSAAAEPGYRRFRLNQRVQSDAGARLLDAETWKAGAHPIDEAIDDPEKHESCGARHGLHRRGYSLRSLAGLDSVRATR